MAGTVFFSVTMSLDGFIAPDSPEELMGQQWMELQAWLFPQRFLRERLGLGAGGEEGRDNDIVRETFERTGASVMGKRMFDAGEHAWPEEAPFRTPVFVVTHEQRDPWKRPGGTTFHVVNDGIESALAQARTAAGDLDVRIAGGGATISSGSSPTHCCPPASSQRGPTTSAPRAATRSPSSRSADTSSTALSAASARATSASSPEPAACTTATPCDSPSSTPARAAPSSTTTTSYGSPATRSRSTSRAAAPARSRHHPSGTEPTTLAASTSSRVTSTGR